MEGGRGKKKTRKRRKGKGASVRSDEQKEVLIAGVPYPLSPIPLLFPPYPLPVSTPASRARDGSRPSSGWPITSYKLCETAKIAGHFVSTTDCAKSNQFEPATATKRNHLSDGLGALTICTEISSKNFRQMVLVFFFFGTENRNRIEFYHVQNTSKCFTFSRTWSLALVIHTNLWHRKFRSFR